MRAGSTFEKRNCSYGSGGEGFQCRTMVPLYSRHCATHFLQYFFNIKEEKCPFVRKQCERMRARTPSKGSSHEVLLLECLAASRADEADKIKRNFQTICSPQHPSNVLIADDGWSWFLGPLVNLDQAMLGDVTYGLSLTYKWFPPFSVIIPVTLVLSRSVIYVSIYFTVLQDLKKNPFVSMFEIKYD